MSSVPAAERRAIMFTDVEGSTQVASTRGDAVASELLKVHESIVRDQLALHGGREELLLGDGFLATFASIGDSIAAAQGTQRALA
ncbi:MAG TPA: DUF4242 domain-containing protein, partial [Actinomycetota bacterium]|nr:DUF4242 domain-containing protein [Actinomycetota bacterium]